jgi:hypothetical protein
VDDVLAGVHDEEVARAVGVLRFADAERGLAECRSLLVAQHSCDRDFAQQVLQFDRSEDLR